MDQQGVAWPQDVLWIGGPGKDWRTRPPGPLQDAAVQAYTGALAIHPLDPAYVWISIHPVW